MRKPGLHHPSFGSLSPLALEGAVGSSVIPACSVCGQVTARVDWHRRSCPDGHLSIVRVIDRQSWLSDRWEVLPCV